MAYSAVNVSNNVLKRAFDEGVDVSPMKLQKLLYFIASEFAKTTEQPLLNESFRAWRYGPVLRSVFDEFRPFGGRPIRAYAKDATGKSFRVKEGSNPELRVAIDRVWSHAKLLSAVELSRITHLPGSAWSHTYQRRDEFIKDREVRDDTTYIDRLHLTA